MRPNPLQQLKIGRSNSMQTVKSRVYTNAILTAIAILLAVVALRPFVDVATDAYARDDRMEAERNTQQKSRFGDESLQYQLLADALRANATATSEVAAATRDSADAQREIAKAIARLGSL